LGGHEEEFGEFVFDAVGGFVTVHALRHGDCVTMFQWLMMAVFLNCRLPMNSEMQRFIEKPFSGAVELFGLPRVLKSCPLLCKDSFIYP
jgi:hypothetical protein